MSPLIDYRTLKICQEISHFVNTRKTQSTVFHWPFSKIPDAVTFESYKYIFEKKGHTQNVWFCFTRFTGATKCHVSTITYFYPCKAGDFHASNTVSWKQSSETASACKILQNSNKAGVKSVFAAKAQCMPKRFNQNALN